METVKMEDSFHCNVLTLYKDNVAMNSLCH